MDLIIRQENKKDYIKSENVVIEAFKSKEGVVPEEKDLVAKLRKSKAFIPELSLVAEFNRKIVGYVLFTKLIIKDGAKEEISLALAPVAVLPEYQNKGIGSRLIVEGLKKAKELGYKSVIVLGHAEYYPRFGFKPASNWNIKPPYNWPDESFMALELEDESLKNVKGTVIYPKEFFE